MCSKKFSIVEISSGVNIIITNKKEGYAQPNKLENMMRMKLK